MSPRGSRQGGVGLAASHSSVMNRSLTRENSVEPRGLEPAGRQGTCVVRCAEATLRVVLSCKRGTLHVRIWRHPSHPDPAYVEKRCELSPAASGCWRVRGTAAGKSSNRLRRRFARRGVITLIYDKRTIGYSLLRRDYGLLAVDAAAAVALLATRRDVDPSRLGLWAQSEGPTSSRSPAFARVRSSSCSQSARSG
jgi:hypothetical protein